MKGLHRCSSKSEHYDSLFADAVITSGTELIATRPLRSRRKAEKMENQGARRTSAARTIEAKKPQSPVIPNAAFFIVAEQSQSVPAARISHSASATRK
jgi:hypothetical protein